jgi:hypothetical protein
MQTRAYLTLASQRGVASPLSTASHSWSSSRATLEVLRLADEIRRRESSFDQLSPLLRNQLFQRVLVVAAALGDVLICFWTFFFAARFI